MGYVIAGMKDVKEAQIGDTLYLQEQPVEALPGFKPAKAMVFAGKMNSHLLLLLALETEWNIKCHSAHHITEHKL